MSSTSAAPVSQRDQAYLALRRLLLVQKIPEGERLAEPEWAQRLGINRSALREAFARLEAEGFIVRGPSTGYFVPQLSDEDIRQVIQVRSILECGAVELICAEPLSDWFGPTAESTAENTAERTPEKRAPGKLAPGSNHRTLRKKLQPLADACDEFEGFLRSEYMLGVAEADRRFHEELVRAAENARLSMLYSRAPLPLIHSQVVSQAGFSQLAAEVIGEHRAILAALLERDAATAIRLLRRHLTLRCRVPLSV
jgi:DNA-binding GntR family transcriptional regulator